MAKLTAGDRKYIAALRTVLKTRVFRGTFITKRQREYLKAEITRVKDERRRE